MLEFSLVAESMASAKLQIYILRISLYMNDSLVCVFWWRVGIQTNATILPKCVIYIFQWVHAPVSKIMFYDVFTNMVPFNWRKTFYDRSMNNNGPELLHELPWYILNTVCMYSRTNLDKKLQKCVRVVNS